MNEIEKRNEMLPDTLKDLTKFVLVGREKLNSVRAEIRAIDKLDLATEVKDQKRDEASMLAGALLDAEARIGELLKDIEPSHGGSIDGKKGGSKKSLPQGITHKQSHYFQTLAENKDVIEQVKAEAKENDDLPTRTEVLRRVQENKRAEIKKQPTPPLPEDKYQVIYADPPWDIGSMVLDKWESPLEDKYPTMTPQELIDLNIGKLADEDCILFMWTTLSTLPQAINLMSEWGFKYHITLTWDKGGGWSASGFHRRTELVIVGYKGILSNVLKQEGEYIPTFFYEKKTTHSTKPKIMYEYIEKRTIGNKVELFCRTPREGWNVWGNEV